MLKSAVTMSVNCNVYRASNRKTTILEDTYFSSWEPSEEPELRTELGTELETELGSLT